VYQYNRNNNDDLRGLIIRSECGGAARKKAFFCLNFPKFSLIFTIGAQFEYYIHIEYAEER